MGRPASTGPREVGRGCRIVRGLGRCGGCPRGEARKEEGPPPLERLGPRRVQLRFAIELTLEQYVAQKAWRTASLEHCPGHPEGGCGFASHGTYCRSFPVPCEVARWYCPKGHVTYGLLPDCLAARMKGTLKQSEQAAAALDDRTPMQQAADRLRPPEEELDAIELASAVQWMKRRQQAVVAGLLVIAGLMPEFADIPATVAGFSERLGTGAVLVTLRRVAAEHLQEVPPPIGFLSRNAAGSAVSTIQQSMRTRR